MMSRFPRLQRRLSAFLFLNMLLSSLFLPAAQAGMVGTEALLDTAQAEQQRAHLQGLLQREDLASELRAAGVEPQQVQARVDALSDTEVAGLVHRLEQVPAGGDVLALAVFLFLVLLVTDIAGYTEIFPFVKHRAR